MQNDIRSCLTLNKYVKQRDIKFADLLETSQFFFWRCFCGCDACERVTKKGLNDELCGLGCSYDIAASRLPRDIAELCKIFANKSTRKHCLQGDARSCQEQEQQYAKVMRFMKPIPLHVGPIHKQHPRVVFLDNKCTKMIFVIEVPANVFDIQFFFGDVPQIQETKQCFGLIEPLDAVSHSVDVLQKSFWQTYGVESTINIDEDDAAEERKILSCIQALKRKRNGESVCFAPVAEITYHPYMPFEKYSVDEWIAMGQNIERYDLPFCSRKSDDEQLRDLELDKQYTTFSLITFKELVASDRNLIRTIKSIVRGQAPSTPETRNFC